ncbi:YkgJ family cysteine cluster protein [Candidatus Nitrosocosmicus franklandus]|uniref:Flagellin N-methylase n=1 Tax=Candidatus Nitrosocosmicus franklandianus TaxID=1798806 RepID=A0A484I7F4_9ARCH|nr:YkgJ family cysteine cluster protein [Candidatus Nitrosocosmicus franklandus]VFJ13036.1 Flagellin N-methylase [Candidatus Nitrosocosmicus franklandus]
MSPINREYEKSDRVLMALENLSKDWPIDPLVRDIHLGLRSDVMDYHLKINQVTYHIPYISETSDFLVWNCLWPDCHNCCEKQGRLPLTIKDVSAISKHLGYSDRSEFLKKETYVTTWKNSTASSQKGSQLITTLTMLNLKRRETEREEDNGKPITCRFLDEDGCCSINSSKPGVCWLYPFYSWSQNENNKLSVHASYQLTGDCPGFFLTKSLEDYIPLLKKYSEIIYSYTMNINSTIREGFARIDITE